MKYMPVQHHCLALKCLFHKINLYNTNLLYTMEILSQIAFGEIAFKACFNKVDVFLFDRTIDSSL